MRNFTYNFFVALLFLVVGRVEIPAQMTPSSPDPDLQQKITALEKLVMQDDQTQAAPTTPSAPQTNSPSAITNVAPSSPAVTTITLTPAGPESRAVRYFHALRQDAFRHDYNNAIVAANNLAGADPTDAVEKAVAEIVPEMQKLRDSQDAGVKDQLKGLLDRTTKTILAAKDPKELDPVIAEVGQAIEQSHSTPPSSDRQAVFLQLEAVNRFVKEWQSYLSDQSAGNTMQAANELRNLANMTDTYMPIPRSELLARALKVSGTEAQSIDSQVEVHSFDDIPAAIGKLQFLQRSGNYSMEMNSLMNSLQGLQNAYQAYLDKNYTGALQSIQNYPMMMDGLVNAGGAPSDKGASHDSLRKEIMALKDTLLVEIMQGLLAMPEAPAPQKDERAPDYLLRVAALKEKAADWPGLMQVLTVYQQISGMFTPQPWLQEDLAGLHSYLVGEKLEAAGQSLDAIRSYRQALATLGRFFPADPAAAKLKELEKSKPDDYKQALEEPIGAKTP